MRIDLTNASHDEAVTALKRAGKNVELEGRPRKPSKCLSNLHETRNNGCTDL